MATKQRAAGRHELPRPARTALRMVWHVADDPEGVTQRCRRCGVALVDPHFKGSTSGAIRETSPAFFDVGYMVLQDQTGVLLPSAFREGDTRARMCEAKE